ncbi:MAG: Hsp20/alpha crystallin family protein [Saprospiraceae bacterium]|nr:Hsp20/alpha crystallin family protein [Saprospiraceae bacterium]
MTTLSFPKRSLLPKITSDRFDAGSFFSPRIWEFDGDFFDMELANRLPFVNIIDTGNAYKFELAAPGLDSKDFKVEIDKGMLTISAEKNEEFKEKTEDISRIEYSYNSFSRTFRLPENCVADKMSAKYENGILRLMIPKSEENLTKTVKEIKVS